MIPIKSQKEITIMKKAGKILAEVLFTVLNHVQPGISEIELDALAEKLIREKGGEPGFKKVPGYKHTICVATNDVVVHGIPTKQKLQEGDIIGIDCGVFLEGWHTDMAETIRVIARSGVSDVAIPKGSAKPIGIASPVSQLVRNDVVRKDEIDTFLRIGKEGMFDGIAQVKPGNRVGHISQAIQRKIEKEGGYMVTRSLIGHGVGRELHEEPEIPGYLALPIAKTPLLRPGMMLAIETIYTMGKTEVVVDRDNWTIKTADGSLGGLFERTVVVTEKGCEIITEK